jgi:mono/diheme cytochrome c family protein
MKKALKYGGSFLAGVVVLIAGLLIYVKAALPDVGDPEEITIEYTPERIERGKYLANHVNACMDCHSTRDWSKFSGPLMEGTLGRGGDKFDQAVGMPGVYYSRNITPAGLREHTDGELFRVITTGVAKDGRAMFPLMPYPNYAHMDREDVYSIIAYLRSLQPIENEVPVSTHDFPMNFIVNTIPAKAQLQTRPDPSDKLAYGAYLTNAAGCRECHTQVSQGQIIPELEFTGGRDFTMLDGSVVRSSNISPDMETGIGKWTEEFFIQRFKIYADSAASNTPVAPGEFNSIMPWTMYAGMASEDLGAIYAFLRTVKPQVNEVEKFTPKN